jgi:hypothetical protein
VTKYQRKQLEEEFILAHGLSSRPLGSIASGPVCGKAEHHGGRVRKSKVTHLMAAKRQREYLSETSYIPKNTHPVTYFLQLGPTFECFHHLPIMPSD